MKKADEIKYALMTWCKGSSYDIVIPNYYYKGFEMDIFRLTHSGIIVEYEIKISRSDFKADFKKQTQFYWKEPKKHKHDILSGGLRCNRYYFVCPEDLIKVYEIPTHAGLIYYGRHFNVVKNARLLTKERAASDPNFYKELAWKLSFRDDLRDRKLRIMAHDLKVYNSTPYQQSKINC